MKRRHLILLLIVLITPSVFAGKITTVEVQSTGAGATLQQAIDSGLLTAIEQVNGKIISEVDLSASLEVSAQYKNNSAYLSSQAYLSVIEQVTHGAVTSFKISKYKQNTDGSWLVTLAVSVAKYERLASENRTRIVVLPPRASQSAYTIFNSHVSGTKVAAAIADHLQNYLVNTNKFTVLDRTYSPELEQERGIAESGEASTEEYALIGQKLVADYVLVGTVQQLNYHENTTHSLTSNHVYSEPTGGMVLAYRLINTATQQVVLSDSVGVTFKEIARPGGTTETAGTVLDRTIEKIAKIEGASVLGQLYPIRILSADQAALIIGAGKDLVSTGQVYKVYAYGEDIIDPDTHESLGKSEMYCCEIRVDRVTPKLSYGSLLPPAKTLTNFSPDKYILEKRISTSHMDNSKISNNTMKAVEDEIKKQQQNDNDGDGGPPINNPKRY